MAFLLPAKSLLLLSALLLLLLRPSPPPVLLCCLSPPSPPHCRAAPPEQSGGESSPQRLLESPRPCRVCGADAGHDGERGAGTTVMWGWPTVTPDRVTEGDVIWQWTLRVWRGKSAALTLQEVLFSIKVTKMPHDVQSQASQKDSRRL